MNDSTDLTDLEHEFADTVARLRDHLPAIAESDTSVDSTSASAADGVVFLDSVGPSTDPVSGLRPGRRRDARRLLAVAAAVVVVLGVAVWWGDRSTDSGPSIADDTDTVDDEQPAEIVLSEDPLIVVLADPSPDVDAIGLEIDQPIMPVAVDRTMIEHPQIGWIEAEVYFGQYADFVESRPDLEVVGVEYEALVVGVTAGGELLFRVDSELLLADGSRYYLGSKAGPTSGDQDPIEDRPWFASGGVSQWREDGEERLIARFSDLGDAVAIRLTTPDTVVTAAAAGGMAEIETTTVEPHTRVRLERFLPDGTRDVMLRDAAVIGLTGVGPGIDTGQGLSVDELGLQPRTVTIYGAEWCGPCNDLDGFIADIDAAMATAGDADVRVEAVPATREEWPLPSSDWPYEHGDRNALIGQFSPTLPWVVITDGAGRAIYSGAIPTRAELIEAFEVLAAE